MLACLMWIIIKSSLAGLLVDIIAVCVLTLYGHNCEQEICG